MSVKFHSFHCRRTLSTVNHSLTSKYVRKRFLEYFINENNHKHVKSCPVVSYCDPSIPFINAGMCQFKNIFTGNEIAAFDKVVNSQKCVRVGGKHNDLQVVGIDSYHHTFFEMLGNWFFNSCDKKLSCKLAWELLTSPPYGIHPSKLFVTYFSGDKTLNLPPDNEVKEIWLELGVHESRILPFGVTENFWEMGLIGPCGPCTEIHVALTDSLCSSPHLVNKSNPLLTELWNIVFIKYNRTENGSIELLPKNYVDTGMGFERLVAVLQGKTSNYDTDLFYPLFNKISEICGTPAYGGTFGLKNLDESYRHLADFTRMVTVAVSDNCFPDTSPKLKRILRKALLIAEHKFRVHSPTLLINELANLVADSLQDTYPEIGENLSQVKCIVEREADSLDHLKTTESEHWCKMREKFPILQQFCFVEYPGIVPAYPFLLEELSKNESKEISAETVFNLYSTYGLETDVIKRLINLHGMEINWQHVEEFMTAYKEQHKTAVQSSIQVIDPLYSEFKTEDSLKYHYTKVNQSESIPYTFPAVDAVILGVTKDNDFISVIDKHSELNTSYNVNSLSSKIRNTVTLNGDLIGIIVDKTNFYTYAGGQTCDLGTITVENEDQRNIILNVVKVVKLKNSIIHYCKINNESEQNATIKAGDKATLKIDEQRRYRTMQNHTAVHLLTSVIKQRSPMSYFKEGKVKGTKLEVNYMIIGNKSDIEDISLIENKVNKHISNGFDVEIRNFPYFSQLFAIPEVTFSPGEIYPFSKIRLTSILDATGKVISRETCCGTHVFNTSDIRNFRITKFSLKKNELIIVAVTGEQANIVTENELSARKQIVNFITDLQSILCNWPILQSKEVINKHETLTKFMYDLLHGLKHNKLEYPHKFNELHELEELKSQLDKLISTYTKDILFEEISSTVNKMSRSNNFVIYFCTLQHELMTKEDFLFDLLNHCTNISVPVLIYTCVDKKLFFVSHVPEDTKNDYFTYETWLRSILKPFGLAFKRRHADNITTGFIAWKQVPEQMFFQVISKLSETAKSVTLEEFQLKDN